jgi:very-short-patch-repair endonuclease
MQVLNIEKDKIKTKVGIDMGYQLIRFWESDIISNIHEVRQKILEIVNTNNCNICQ